MSNSLVSRKEFESVRLVVVMTEYDVQIWAYDTKTGKAAFRMKALGKVTVRIEDLEVISP